MSGDLSAARSDLRTDPRALDRGEVREDVDGGGGVEVGEEDPGADSVSSRGGGARPHGRGGAKLAATRGARARYVRPAVPNPARRSGAFAVASAVRLAQLASLQSLSDAVMDASSASSASPSAPRDTPRDRARARPRRVPDLRLVHRDGGPARREVDRPEAVR